MRHENMMFNINGASHLIIFLTNLHSPRFAGKSTVNHEEGGHPDAQPQVVVEVEEEERRRRVSADGPLGRPHEAAGRQTVPRWLLRLDG